MGQALRRGPALDDVVASVARARPRLVDAWEAAAVIESLGYHDARVQREFGFPDTITLGSYVFDALAARPSRTGSDQGDAPRPPRNAPLRDALNSVSASVTYAAPWLAAVLLGRFAPGALRLPARADAPLALALIASLIVSGGFVQAIVRRGQLYLAMEQPGLASLVCTYLFRLGAAATVIVALGGLIAGWALALSPWPYLVLAADQFVVLSLLWMTFGILVVRQEQWRVALALGIAVFVFLVLRAAGRDTLLAELLASGAALAAALAQVPAVFKLGTFKEQAGVPLPRLPVLLYRLLPFFLYGTLYFCFLFADRLAAADAGSDERLGMDVALMTFFFASAAVEYANLRFTRRLLDQVRDVSSHGPLPLAASLRRLHDRMLGLVVLGYVPVAALVFAGAQRLWPGAPRAAWAAAALGDAGYLLLGLGLLNALILFSLNRASRAVGLLAAALAVTLTVGFELRGVTGVHAPATALIAGALVLAIASTAVARLAFRNAGQGLATT